MSGGPLSESDLSAHEFKRQLVLEIDDDSGDVTWDDSTFTPFEVLGISEKFFDKVRSELYSELEED